MLGVARHSLITLRTPCAIFDGCVFYSRKKSKFLRLAKLSVYQNYKNWMYFIRIRYKGFVSIAYCSIEKKSCPLCKGNYLEEEGSKWVSRERRKKKKWEILYASSAVPSVGREYTAPAWPAGTPEPSSCHRLRQPQEHAQAGRQWLPKGSEGANPELGPEPQGTCGKLFVVSEQGRSLDTSLVWLIRTSRVTRWPSWTLGRLSQHLSLFLSLLRLFLLPSVSPAIGKKKRMNIDWFSSLHPLTPSPPSIF